MPNTPQEATGRQAGRRLSGKDVSQSVAVYLFTFLARPLQEPASSSDPAGAYVNCWVDLPSRDVAEQRARDALAEFPWAVMDLEECRVVSESDYPANGKLRDYYDQACVDGLCVLFHSWPLAGDDQSS